VYGLVQGLGLAQGLQILPFLPTDLKRVFTNSASASKEAVADVVLGQATGLAAFLDRLPAGQHEHVPMPPATHSSDSARWSRWAG
jgi:hypothetical protein